MMKRNDVLWKAWRLAARESAILEEEILIKRQRLTILREIERQAKAAYLQKEEQMRLF